MTDLNTQEGFSYEGDIYAQRYEAGVLQAKAIGPFEVTVFGLKPANEVKERLSNRLNQTGKTRGSVGRTLATELKIGFNAANSDMYAALFLGSVAALSEAGGTVTAEAIADMEHDKWYKLAHQNVSSVVITGKTIDVDYEVQAHLGLIRILSTGTLADLYDASINYTYSAVTGTRVKIGTESKLDVKIWGDAKNRETGTYSRLLVPKVTLTPSNEIELIADEYATAEVTGKCVLLDSETADFYLDTSLTYA